MYKKILKELVEIPGIPSHEHKVRDYILNKLKGSRAELTVTNLGCIVARFKGSSSEPAVMLDAHMDEVGYVVQYIENSGFLKITNYGGIDPRVAPNQVMEVHSSNGKVYKGVIGILPPHVTGAKEPTVIPLENLSLDCGFKSIEEVKKAGIRVGSQVTFEHKFVELENDRFSTKAIDDRLGCTALIMIADFLNKEKTKRDIVLSFSVQEEGGLRGAGSVTEYVKPEYALAVEATTACDMDGVANSKQITKLGEGIAFTPADNHIFVNPDMLDFLIKIAEENKIKYQIKTPKFGGTNAGAIHQASVGVKTGVVAVPTRYLHSPVSVAQWSDVECVIGFLKAYVKKF